MQVGGPVTGTGTPLRESHMARHKQTSVDGMKKPLPVMARLLHYACDSRAAKPASFDKLDFDSMGTPVKCSRPQTWGCSSLVLECGRC